MSIRYDWYNADNTVIRLVFEKEWTWDDYINIQALLFAMIDTVNHSVHYLVDVSAVRSLPLSALSKLPTIFSRNHPRRGKTVIFGANPIVQNIWNLLRKVLPQMHEPRYVFVPSIIEAEALLQTWQNAGQSSLAKEMNTHENQI